jgi:hypothetical protein
LFDGAGFVRNPAEPTPDAKVAVQRPTVIASGNDEKQSLLRRPR